MLQIELMFRAAFYIAKIARLSIIIGAFGAIEKRILWMLRPIKSEKIPTRLERVSDGK